MISCKRQQSIPMYSVQTTALLRLILNFKFKVMYFYNPLCNTFFSSLSPLQGILNSIIRTVSVCERLIVILIMQEAALARICQYADLILCNVLCRADFSVCNRNNGPCFMKTGTLSSGASAKIYLPPLYFSPV